MTNIKTCGHPNTPRLFLLKRRYFFWLFGFAGLYASYLGFAEGRTGAPLWCAFSFWVMLPTSIKNVVVTDSRMIVDFYFFVYDSKTYGIEERLDFYSAPSLKLRRYAFELIPVYFVLSPVWHDVIINPIFLEERKETKPH